MDAVDNMVLNQQVKKKYASGYEIDVTLFL